MGAVPYPGVTMDTAGTLYGATNSGGAFRAGVVYKLTPNATGEACCAGRGVSSEDKIRRRMALALRSSPRHNPLVNGAPQRRRSSVEGGSTYVVVGKTW